ncbi:DUF4440 domain-containing protein [Mesorhizobium sp. NBSH29]|uniref:DUF4440 domain-containing protein n=1 Tax=Mesorhizobium sp. NBSH29 TaxID=2654249 RepID=UPI0018967D95|nr:nuclear transport factor 2 family protein [Mesorhizobium sp. NBSH29]QPC85873.1 DUF4440 domain-containing protein [Mesorhizobium sp. NBSH29]
MVWRVRARIVEAPELLKNTFFAGIVMVLAVLQAPVQAQADVIARWFAALEKADAPALDALMSDDAVVVLDDIDVEQSKAEFLASMEQWKESVGDAKIRYRLDGTEGEVSTVLVCYDFPSNDMMIREAFTLEAGKVRESRQSHVADDCDAF